MTGHKAFDEPIWSGPRLRAQAVASELRAKGIESLSTRVVLSKMSDGVTVDAASSRLVGDCEPTQSACGELVTVLVDKQDREHAREILCRLGV
jgi:hypothetical protein